MSNPVPVSDHLNNETEEASKSVILVSNDSPVQLVDFGPNFVVTKLENGQTVLSLNQYNLQTPIILEQGASINLAATNSILEETTSDSYIYSSSINSVENIIESFKLSLNERLEGFERKLDDVAQRYQQIEMKLKNAMSQLKEIELLRLINNPQNKARIDSLEANFVKADTNEGPLLLNSEKDYPNGSWLGDPNNIEKRVRCCISEKVLEQLKTSCDTPEKMALTLLDYLFDRETQACSNISGTGKHGKKQLDPLKIYGIYCHVNHYFNIDEVYWKRIKINLDSKCRSAFRRKQNGLSLNVKSFKDKSPYPKHKNLIIMKGSGDEELSDGSLPSSLDQTNLTEVVLPSSLGLQSEPQIIQTEEGTIHIVQASDIIVDLGQIQVVANTYPNSNLLNEL